MRPRIVRRYNDLGIIKDVFPVQMLLTKKKKIYYLFILVFSLGYCAMAPAIAQIPSSADVSRIENDQRNQLRDSKFDSVQVSSSKNINFENIPAEAAQITFTLRDVNIEGGAGKFKVEHISMLYADLLDQETTLYNVYVLAAQITDLYRQNGFFLSRAFIPEQEIINGAVTIRIVEGYIDNVRINNQELLADSYFEGLKTDFLSNRPISAKDIESFLLRLNDFPGVSVYGTLEASNGKDEAAVDLSINVEKEKGTGFVQIDNYGSRFLGPYQLNASYRDSFIRGQSTTLSTAKSLFQDELSFLSLSQDIALSSKLSLNIQGAYTSAHPGFTLQPLDIDSESLSFRTGVDYAYIRQLQENLTLSTALHLQNAESNTLDFELSKDRIRSLEISANYNTYDKFSGYHSLYTSLMQGLDIFNSSNKGDQNLSRAEADPDFTLLGARYNYQKSIQPNWFLNANIKAQVSSAPLFSAHEFGVGGSTYGRAYDSSEITGDSGLAAALELSYTGLSIYNRVKTVPYAFFDGGRVINQDSGGDSASAVSAGFGSRFTYDQKISFDASAAFPLTRDIETPLNGSEKGPRLRLGLSYGF